MKLKKDVQQSVAWAQAASFDERLSGLGTTQLGDELQANDGKASERVRRWRRSKGFAEQGVWREFLEGYEISELALGCLLTESAEMLTARLAPSPWISTLTQIFNTPTSHAGTAYSDDPFYPFIAPFVAYAETALNDLRQRSDSCFTQIDNNIFTQLLKSLAKNLMPLVSQTLTFEQQVAEFQQGLEKAPATHAVSFAQTLSDKQVVFSILLEYPVLGRRLVTDVCNWIATHCSFLRRCANDWPQLQENFCQLKQDDRLVKINNAVSDPHCGGQQVIIATFESGTRLVYKPKSLAIDQQFQQLLAWTNSAGFTPQIRLLNILDCGTHGWVEYVYQRSCDDEMAMRRFFERQGGLLALLYVIRGTDFHYENVIADGENPVLIDLETLFHPDFDYSQGDAGEDAVAEQFRNSVMGASLLPQPSGSGSDTGGMGRGLGGRNEPKLCGQPVAMTAYSAEFLHGFTQMYQLLQHNQQHLLSSSSPLIGFKHLTIRIVLRNSAAYDTIQRNLRKPNRLRTGLEQMQQMNLLWAAVHEHPVMREAIPHEVRDLEQQDIPYFTTLGDSTTLITSDGTHIENFFEQSGYALVMERIASLGSKDFALQTWYTRAAIATLTRPSDVAMSRYDLTASQSPTSALTLAESIGNQLDAIQLGSGTSVGWVGVNQIDDHYVLHPIDIDLHNGLAGIALFYAQLAAATGAKHWQTQAAQTAMSLLHWVEKFVDRVGSPGLYDGWGGVIHALVQIGTLLDDEDMIYAAEQIADFLADTLAETTDLSVAHGLAGVTLGLLELNTVSTRPSIQDHLQFALDQLLENVGSAAPQALGLAKGQAGIMLVLARGSRQLSAPALMVAAEKIAERISESVSSAELNCSQRDGWAGIGIAALAVTGQAASRLVKQATEQVLIDGFGRNHSLIYGDFGALDFLLAAQHDCSSQTQHLINTVVQHGPLCGVPQAVPTPGFLHGLAGIGYGLLRASNLETIPSMWHGSKQRMQPHPF